MFEIQKKIDRALGRAATIQTKHGEIQTPCFVAVGTKATIKSLTPEQVGSTGSQAVLANTYHLYLEPGDQTIRENGGLAKYMHWEGPTFTDSGGFQAFSLGVAYGEGIGKFIDSQAPEKELLEKGLSNKNKMAKVTEEGVEFKSIIDGSTHFLSPEKSIEIQRNIGADIIFALDEFTSPHAEHSKIKSTIERTNRWAERCLGEFRKNNPTLAQWHPLPQGEGGEFIYQTTDKSRWKLLHESALNMRKHPTDAEKILWEVLRKNATGLHFRRQHIIDRFIVDFLCLEQMLIVEVDGDIHDYQKENDKIRDAFLNKLGFVVLRFKNHEVLNDVKKVTLKIISHVRTLPLGEGLGGVDQSLFGIVQGGRHEDLRKASAKSIGEMDFDGFGIGGTFIKEDMATAVRWVNEVLPEEKPRHLLGVGEPLDMFLGVENGCDTFDCVAPTRMARNGALYTRQGKINILNAKYRNVMSKIDDNCECYTCSNFTAGYLSHLFRAKEMLAATLATIHNLHFLNTLMSEMRQSIIDGEFFDLKENFFTQYRG